MRVALLVSAGCSAAPASPPADAAVFVQVGPGGDVGQNDATVCGVPTHTFAMPDLVDDCDVGSGSVAQDGSEDSGGNTLHVHCGVRATGDAFIVDTAIARDDGLGATISGTMSRASSEAQATFSQGGVTFTSQAPCSVDFSAAYGMDIEPGRVWAVITCPRATDDRGNTCLASAEFLFERCE
jgi:hypothetical protein